MAWVGSPSDADWQRSRYRAFVASEEALVVAAIAAGQPVHRSLAAPPQAVLGVRIAGEVSRAA